MPINKKHPPKVAVLLLKCLYNYQQNFSIAGDLEEFFYIIQENKGRCRAYFWFWFQTFYACFSYNTNEVKWGTNMLKNYFKSAFRNMRQTKLYSTINIAGLATGIASCILVFLFIKDEYSYDKFHKNIENIYFLSLKMSFGEGNGYAVNSPNSEIASKLISDFPEVKAATRVFKDELIVKKANTSVKKNVVSADPSFFNIFTFPIIQGNRKNPLKDKFTVVITEKLSRELYGNSYPIGEVVQLKIGEEFVNFTITGTMENIPGNSSIQFDFITNINSIYDGKLSGKGKPVETFLLLSDGKLSNQLHAKFASSIDKDATMKIPGMKIETNHFLSALADFHFQENGYSSFLSNEGNINYIFILSGISLLILLVSCFNYTNLSISNFTNRLKEVGIRKVMGAEKRQISRQFLFESIFICSVSMMFGIIVSILLMPLFNFLVDKQLSFELLLNSYTLLFFVSFTILVSIVAGGYPAIIFSRIALLELFKGKFKISGKNILSKTLIILQFSIAIFLIVVTIFLSKQLNFMLEKELGYDPQNIIQVDLGDITENLGINQAFYKNFKNTLSGSKNIDIVCASYYNHSSSWMYWFNNKLKNSEKKIGFDCNSVDADYVNLFKICIVEGNNYKPDNMQEMQKGIIVNERFVKEAGLKDPIGKKLGDVFDDFKRKDSTIIAIVKDYHYRSTSQKIVPMLIAINNDAIFRYAFVKFNGSEKEAVETIQNAFKKFAENIPFKFSFLDSEIELQYQKEKKWSRVVQFASTFAIIIACAGLFALTLMVTTKRMKEIGIRKVMGASVLTITKMINKEFIWLVCIANLIAWPAAFYIVDKFLQDYAYKINVDLWIFPASGLLVIFISVATISILAFRAAKRNPVDVLKYE